MRRFSQKDFTFFTSIDYTWYTQRVGVETNTRRLPIHSSTKAIFQHFRAEIQLAMPRRVSKSKQGYRILFRVPKENGFYQVYGHPNLNPSPTPGAREDTAPSEQIPAPTNDQCTPQSEQIPAATNVQCTPAKKSKSNDCRGKKPNWLHLPFEVWRDIICDRFMSLNNRSLLRQTSSLFDALWQDVVKMRKISVPRGCCNIIDALELARLLCQRLKKPGQPFLIELQEGEHEMPDKINTTIHCNDIVFVGRGPMKTTICGGFRINGKTGIGFHNLSISNPWGSGLTLCALHRTPKTRVVASNCRFHRCYLSGVTVIGHRAKLRAVRCEIVQSKGDGLTCSNAAKVRLIDCTIHNNLGSGISARQCNTQVHIRGTKTSIHQNKTHGMYVINFAIVRIFLPQSHKTASKNGSNNIETEASVSFYKDGEVLWEQPQENDHQRYLVLNKALKRLKSSVY